MPEEFFSSIHFSAGMERASASCSVYRDVLVYNTEKQQQQTVSALSCYNQGRGDRSAGVRHQQTDRSSSYSTSWSVGRPSLFPFFVKRDETRGTTLLLFLLAFFLTPKVLN